jgi:predicted RNA methylase
MSMRFGPASQKIGPRRRAGEIGENLFIWAGRLLKPPTQILEGTRLGLTGLSLMYGSSQVRLHGGRVLGDAVTVFRSDDYSWLPVEGRVVVDVGASVGDSPIYFRRRGARRVLAFEANPISWAFMLWNLRSNAVDGVEPVCRIVRDLDFAEELPSGAVLKMDCEGAEESVLSRSRRAALRKFSYAIVEYHNGPDFVTKLLAEAGFDVSSADSTESPGQPRTGLVYAKSP